MDMLIELVVVIVVVLICVAVLFALFKFLLEKTAAALILNAIGGIVILLIANYFFKMLIPYDVLTLLVCIAGGVPGAACVIILDLVGVIL